MWLAWFMKNAKAINLMFMKKILTLLVVATSVATVSNAQLQKGNVLVGSDLADFSIGLKKPSVTSLTLSPKAAWFINNNVAVGAYVNLGLVSFSGSTSTIYGFGPLARYYVNDPKVNLLQHGRFFFEGNLGIGGTNGGGSSTNGLDYGFGPGYAYFITQNIGLETLLKYKGNAGFGNTPSTSTLDLNIGFQIYLPGRATANKVMRDIGK